MPEEELFAWAKLTRSLRVVGVRPGDGYHLIDAEMVSLDLADSLFVDAGGVDTLPADDLVSRALVAVGRSAAVRVVKRIPAGAGLGGGSADAAAILRWAGCTSVEVAAGLGADVPFCLVGGGRARVSGIGEVVVPLPAEDRVFTLLTPPVHVSTPAVYRAWDALGGPTRVAGGNDLLPAALAVEPSLVRWRDGLAAATGIEPRLAGSGGTWFVEGAFPGLEVGGVRAVVARTRSDRPAGRPSSD
ncbi:MAG TPA: 4-(cytidine 5'-diphospho)-2-C-methyl-D-erythritol kinase [Acidimicrobiales bacterium]|nr:4-(cytidine 5'-diphospho)-2-C-methyl-D-erythritol kinase [Acidimicrobiales bacterium]